MNRLCWNRNREIVVKLVADPRRGMKKEATGSGRSLVGGMEWPPWNAVTGTRLSASGPVDAALVDLDGYETWELADEMPSSPRFANDTRSVDWQAQPSSPLCTVVLVVFNPGVHSVQVKAIVKALPSEHQATESGGTADSGTPVRRGKSFHPH